MMTSDLTYEQIDEAILEGLAKGKKYRDIGEPLGLSAQAVLLRIRAMAKDAQKRNQERCDEAYLRHCQAAEYLYRKCVEAIERSQVFNRDAVTLAIKVLERDARLRGLDRQTNDPTKNDKYDWLAKASDSELAAMAKQYGIPLPKRFDQTSIA